MLICVQSLHLNRLLRAHLLTAEASDTLFIIIYRRILFSFSESHSFTGNRAAVYANAAANTFIRFDIGLLLENIQGFG